MTREESLKRQIESAFTDTKYPGDNNIVPYNIDCYSEYSEVKDAFLGKDWRESSPDLILDNSYHGFNFFTKEARCFYLPAYMNASLTFYAKDLYGEAATIAESIVFTFSLPGASKIRHNPNAVNDFLDFVKNFSASQGEAILGFFEYLKEEHGAAWGYDEDDPMIFEDGDLESAIEFWRNFSQSGDGGGS
jgi:hypothetical protein